MHRTPNPQPARARRVPVHFLVLLLAAFAMLTVAASRIDITDDEARLLWIVRDPERIEPASISDTVRMIGRNFRAMMNRARANSYGILVAVPLDLWTTLAGGSIFVARLLITFLVCLVLAVLIRIFSRARFTAVLFGLFLIGALAVYGVKLVFDYEPRSIQYVVREYLASRPLSEPVITEFRDDEPLGYYHAQYDLRRGIGIDLGWRQFTDEEIGRAVAVLKDQPIWFITAAYSGGINSVAKAFEEERVIVWCRGRDFGGSAMRYDLRERAIQLPSRENQCGDS